MMIVLFLRAISFCFLLLLPLSPLSPLSSLSLPLSLKQCEDTILHILSASEGNILEDQSAIEALNSSKTISDTIKEKQAIADQTEIDIDAIRMQYLPAAYRGSLLYFCIASLASIEPTYQYSLNWFSNLFVKGCQQATPSNVLDERVEHINSCFTYMLYRNVCRSLLEKDKLLFSFLLTIKILAGDGKVRRTHSKQHLFLCSFFQLQTSITKTKK